MGTNNLATKNDGDDAVAVDVNQLIQALRGVLVPRNSSDQPEDVAGGLGSTTFRWDTSYIKSLVLGAIASQISLEDSSGKLIIKVAGSTVATIGSSGIETGSFKQGAIERSALATNIGIQQGSLSSSPYLTDGTGAEADVPGLTLTITTTGRPVFLALASTSNLGAYVFVSSSIGGVPSIKVYRGASQVTGFRLAIGHTYTPSSIWYIDQPSAGTYTYKITADDGDNDGNKMTFENIKLIAFEI